MLFISVLVVGVPFISELWEKDSPLASNVSKLSMQSFIQSSAIIFESEVLEMI